MSKRLSILISLVCAAALTLCSCGNAEKETKTEKPSAKPREEKKTDQKQYIIKQIKLLSHKDYSVREDAARKLELMNDKTCIPMLTKLLSHKQADTRLLVVRILREIGDKSVIPVIDKMLEDEDSNVREMAIYSLARLGDPKAIPLLLNLLKELPDNDDLSGKILIVCMVFVDTGEPGIQALVNTFEQEDADLTLRVRCIICLGVLLPRDVLPNLIKGLKNKNYRIRANCAESIGYFGYQKKAWPVLLDALNDEHWLVRESVIGAFASIGNKSIIPRLIKVLSDNQETSIGLSAIYALKELSEQDFGHDVTKWQEWWEANKDSILKEAAGKNKDNVLQEANK